MIWASFISVSCGILVPIIFSPCTNLFNFFDCLPFFQRMPSMGYPDAGHAIWSLWPSMAFTGEVWRTCGGPANNRKLRCTFFSVKMPWQNQIYFFLKEKNIYYKYNSITINVKFSRINYWSYGIGSSATIESSVHRIDIGNVDMADDIIVDGNVLTNEVPVKCEKIFHDFFMAF